MNRHNRMIQNVLRCQQSSLQPGNLTGRSTVKLSLTSCLQYKIKTDDSCHFRSIRGITSSPKLQSTGGKSNDLGGSSVVDGLEASSNWRRGQLSKLSDKFDSRNHGSVEEIERDTSSASNKVDMSEPLRISSDEDVQQMWKEMENRVTRRRTMTVPEAIISGKGVGRKNLRKTDEEAWLEAGLYDGRVDK
mmetsp:Transcript_15842/g.20108  ORF Transcript_15842/g.20108 Transcript_15842/m.20108 type:complete len:190 (+) Transcript_15842:124-693(+)